MSLSERLRPNVECAPWIIEEVVTLETTIERLRDALEEKETAMHLRIRREYDATVAECWRRENERLQSTQEQAMELLERARAMLEFGTPPDLLTMDQIIAALRGEG